MCSLIDFLFHVVSERLLNIAVSLSVSSVTEN